MSVHEGTKRTLARIAERYGLGALERIAGDDDSSLWGKDVAVCIKGILRAIEKGGDIKENLKDAKNIYNGPVFAINPAEGRFLIENEPDPEKAVEDLSRFDYCFKLSPYHVVNTYLALLVAQVTGMDLDDLVSKGVDHIEGYIAERMGGDRPEIRGDSPALVMPIGAAGCGKSTFFAELEGVVNISCDNVRYLLFKDYGPCFASWESTLAWWVVNRLTDMYLEKGYSVFYNGVNTDLEYRSPITMENPDPLYAGMPYRLRLVYFDPPVALTGEELSELKGVNLWATPIEEVDTSSLSPNVARIIELVKENFTRTLKRTEEIKAGRAEQDPFDVLYAVPAPVVKLFVEQSFDKPRGDNVIEIPRKDLPDPAERSAFYREYAAKVKA